MTFTVTPAVIRLLTRRLTNNSLLYETQNKIIPDLVQNICYPAEQSCKSLATPDMERQWIDI